MYGSSFANASASAKDSAETTSRLPVPSVKGPANKTRCLTVEKIQFDEVRKAVDLALYCPVGVIKSEDNKFHERQVTAGIRAVVLLSTRYAYHATTGSLFHRASSKDRRSDHPYDEESRKVPYLSL